jgi:hypothetical protein
MKISANVRDDALPDGDPYDRVPGRYRPSQDYQQGQSYQGQDYQNQDYQNQDYYLQRQDDEALPIVSTNDWWRLLLPNPWMEVHRL